MIIRRATNKALQAVRARSGRLRMHPDPLMAEFCQVFEGYGRSFLAHPEKLAHREAALAMSGLVTEGLVLVDEAINFARACAKAVVADDGTYVAFLGVLDRPRCVKLSPITEKLLQQDAVWLGTGDPIDALGTWVEAQSISTPRSEEVLELAPLERLEMAAAGFWLKHLPPPLLTDAIAEMTIVPLPLSALVRRVSRAPLRRVLSDDAPVDDVQARAAMLLEASNVSSDSSIADQVKAILNRPQEGGRGTHRRRQLDDLTNQVEAAEDDAKGLFYAFYASGLLTIGTVKSEDPSDSIKRRYFLAIEEMVEKLSLDPLLVKRLHLFSREKRGELYDDWILRAKTPGDMSAALSALDLYFVVQFDAEPARVRSFRWECAGFAAPQILWPHEQQAIAVAIARCARTPAIASVASCLVELARQRSFRPSDVMYATLGDVHDYGPSHVVFDVRRHRGEPAPKTEAAEHPLEFLEAEKQVPLLKAYVEQEMGRGRALDEPLWGATSAEARRNFRDAWALINQLAKAYTGDPTASIYAFRHTWFSTQLEAALMPGGTQLDHRILHRIARDGGHRDVTTSITWYFHLLMTPLRAHADIALESLLDAKLTKQWSTLSMVAIYQRVSRSKGREGTPLVDAIRHSLEPSKATPITQDFPCQPLTHEPTASGSVTLTDILSTVAYVDAHRPWWQADGARGPLNEFEQRIAEERRPLLAHYDDPVVLVNVAQEKLATLHKYLQLHGTSQAVRKACSAFEAGRYEGYIDVEHHESLLIWLALLLPAGVRPSRMVIRMVEPTEQEFDNMINRFAAATRMEPCIDKVCSGYERPRAYLLLSSQDIPPGKAASSSATHMGGFNSLMIAAAIRLRLIETKNI